MQKGRGIHCIISPKRVMRYWRWSFGYSHAIRVTTAILGRGVKNWLPITRERISLVRKQSYWFGGHNLERMQLRNLIKMSTWNVQGLRTHTGKLSIIERELARYNIGIAGLAETHWTGEEYFKTREGNYIYFSGSEQQNFTGVAILVSQEIGHRIQR